MSNKIMLSEAVAATKQLPELLKAVKKVLEPYLFSDAMKEGYEDLSNVLLSIADTEVSFLINQSRIEPLANTIRAERIFKKENLN